MRNVTISMDDETLAIVRVDAAKAGKSMSRYIADILRERTSGETEPSSGDRHSRIEKLEKVLRGPKWDLLRESPLPNAAERNDR